MARATSLLLFNVLSIVAHVQSARKCCAFEHILDHLLQCVPWDRDILLADELQTGFPNCSEFKVVPAYQDEGDVSCIDNMLAEDRVKLVGLVCNNSDKFPVPEVDFLNKCCAANRKYTDYKWGCWDRNISDDDTTLMQFTNAVLNASDVVNVRVGVPECKRGYVLVDYKLPYSQIRRQDSESVLLTFPGEPDMLLIPEDICLDLTANDAVMVVRACMREELVCGKGTLCIRKCCPDGESYVGPKVCGNAKRKFDPQFYDYRNNTLNSAAEVVPAIAQDVYCGDKFVVNPYSNHEDLFYILNTGELYLPKFTKEEDRYRVYGEYCIEDVHIERFPIEGIFPFVCFERIQKTVKKPAQTHIENIIKSTAATISSSFLLVTFLVYSCLPQLQNLHGKTIMCYVLSLLAAYVCLTSLLLLNRVIPPPVCITLGYSLQFLFLSAFSWLNVICFNIWWSIRSVRSNFLKKQGTTYKFLLYCLYAWGLPFTITTITLLADVYSFLPESLSPRMGDNYCFFHTKSFGKTIFFDIPTSIQFALNTIMFILTIRVCSRVKSELERMQNNTSAKLRYQSDKNKLILNIKLFIVMGLSWVCEALSWYFKDEWVIRILYLSDAANVLQGIFIFFILVVKKKVLRAIKERLHTILPCCFIKLAKHRPSTTSTIFTTTGSESKLNSSQIRK